MTLAGLAATAAKVTLTSTPLLLSQHVCTTSQELAACSGRLGVPQEGAGRERLHSVLFFFGSMISATV